MVQPRSSSENNDKAQPITVKGTTVLDESTTAKMRVLLQLQSIMATAKIVAEKRQQKIALHQSNIDLQHANARYAQKLKEFVMMLNIVANTNAVATPVIFLYLFKDYFSDKTKRNMMLVAGALKFAASFGLFYANQNPLLTGDPDLAEFIIPRDRTRYAWRK